MNLPVVFVPGLLCSAEVWGPQVSELWAERSTQVASTLAADTIEEVASSILDAAPARFALAGISMGGYVCMEIMRQAPQRVDRLALLDTSARPDTPEQSAGRWALLEQLRAGDFVEAASDALTSILHPAHQDDSGIRAVNRTMAMRVGADGLARHTRIAIGRPDSRPSLPDIDVRTLVMVGAEDPLTPPELSTEIAHAIRGASLRIIPECGHGSTLEQPRLVTEHLRAWLED